MYLGYSCYRRTEPLSTASRASTLPVSLLQYYCVSTATLKSNSTRVLWGSHSCWCVEIRLKMPVVLWTPVGDLPKDCLHLWSLVGPVEKPMFIFWDFRISKHLEKIKGFGIGFTLCSLAHVAWKGCGDFVPGSIQKSPGHSPGQPTECGLAWAWVLSQMTFRGPFQLQWYCDFFLGGRLWLFPFIVLLSGSVNYYI